jgi:oligosaccharide repeat unit polymerase
MDSQIYNQSVIRFRVNSKLFTSFILALLGILGFLIFGTPALPYTLMALCISGTFNSYKSETSIFNLSGIFYFSTLVFMAIPSIIIQKNFDSGIWYSDFIPKLFIYEEEFYATIGWIILGIFSFFIGNTIFGIFIKKDSNHQRKKTLVETNSRLFITIIVYSISVLGTVILTLVRFGDIGSALSYATNPTERVDVNALSSLGINVILLSLATTSAFFITSKIKFRLIKTMIFLPPLFLAVPLTSRGFLLSILLVSFLSMNYRLPKNPLLTLFFGYFLVVVIASFLLAVRGTGTSSDRSFNLLSSFESFNAESTMLPTMTLMQTSLKENKIQYVNGFDILLAPGLLLPKTIWVNKPLPLSFRIGDLLGYDGTSGTPVSVFGGVYINFTPYFYFLPFFLLGLILRYLDSRVKILTLVKVLVFIFIIDLVRVGDLSRETFSLTIWLFSISFLRFSFYLIANGKSE